MEPRALSLGETIIVGEVTCRGAAPQIDRNHGLAAPRALRLGETMQLARAQPANPSWAHCQAISSANPAMVYSCSGASLTPWPRRSPLKRREGVLSAYAPR